MIKNIFLGFFFIALTALSLPVSAAVQVGQPAPDFSGTDSNGVTHKLSDLKGKIVVLEWSNHQCPYVVKHYGSGNMQALQEKATKDGVIWLTIVSSAEGKQGHTSGAEANSLIEDVKAKSTARILDTTGSIGKLYGARTTPHMFVVNEEGVLAYAGAIDNNSSFRPETIEGATNYVQAALDNLAAGEKVAIASTKPYGCSVKY